MSTRRTRWLDVSDLQFQGAESPLAMALSVPNRDYLVKKSGLLAAKNRRAKCIKMPALGRVFWVGHTLFGRFIFDAEGRRVLAVYA